MYRIGDFSKLGKTTVKTLRFYEEAGLLYPAAVDAQSGYRYYETLQLATLQRISACRQAGLSVAEIRLLLNGAPPLALLQQRREALAHEQRVLASQLTALQAMIQAEQEEKNMNYQATIRQLPGCTVFFKQGTLKDMSELNDFVLEAGAECAAANPGLACTEPNYCYVSYLDPEFTPVNTRVEFAQAVVRSGKETEHIHFKTLNPVSAVCVLHKGPYETLGEAYSFALSWAEKNGWQLCENPRECYLDGCWNQPDSANWLTEIQLPVMQTKQEVKERWGNTPEYSQAQGAGKEVESLRAAQEIFDAFAGIRTADPAGREAHELVARWQAHITKYHYACSNEILSCLGQMYTADDRFRENIDRSGAGTAAFMSAAIAAYCAK